MSAPDNEEEEEDEEDEPPPPKGSMLMLLSRCCPEPEPGPPPAPAPPEAVAASAGSPKECSETTVKRDDGVDAPPSAPAFHARILTAVLWTTARSDPVAEGTRERAPRVEGTGMPGLARPSRLCSRAPVSARMTMGSEDGVVGREGGGVRVLRCAGRWV